MTEQIEVRLWETSSSTQISRAPVTAQVKHCSSDHPKNSFSQIKKKEGIPVNKGRLEALTDGIIAIAATIMVLQLQVPETADWSGLVSLNSTFIAYVVSFLMIASCWRTHHDLFQRAELITPKTFLLNIVWLLPVTLLPFVTAWVGVAPKAPAPSLLYELDQFLCLILIKLLRRQMEKDNPDMKKSEAGLPAVIIQYAVYLGCMAAIPLYPPISLWVTGISAVINHIYFLREKGKNT